MPRVTILTEAELRKCVALDLDAVSIVEGAFRALAEGGVVMPPILSMAIEAHRGEVDVKTAYVPGLDSFAIKVSPGFFDNPKRGLPSLNGLMMLFDAETGIVKAVLLDNGYLTDVRTAAAGAVAAQHLAPRDVRTAGVIGAGIQAELQIRALKLVRDFSELIVWARDPAEGGGLCAEDAGRARRAGPRRRRRRRTWCATRRSWSPRRRRAQPLIRAEWLHPGLHITAMGSDAARQERARPANPDRRRPLRLRPQQPEPGAGASCARPSRPACSRADHRADELGEICRRPKARPRQRGRDHGLRPDRHRRAGHRHRNPCLSNCPGARARAGDRELIMAGNRRDHRHDAPPRLLPAQLADVSLLREFAYCGGTWRAANSGATIEVTDPATQERIGTVPDMGAAETRAAIDAAQAAFGPWRALAPQERSKFLRSWFDLIVANREDLAIIMTLEQGKPLAESRGEIDYAASFVEWFAEEAKRLDGEMPASHLPNRLMTVRREPVGVAAAVTPWNFPSAMITRKAAAALAAGCTMIVRPASETPFSALALAVLAERAGFPPGTFSVLTGRPRPIVGELCANPARPRGELHRVDGGGEAAAQAGRRKRQAHVDGARRPRALHPLPRCRSRRSG